MTKNISSKTLKKLLLYQKNYLTEINEITISEYGNCVSSIVW